MDSLICPQCGSAKVEASVVVGGEARATCSNCGWLGKRKDLLNSGDVPSALEIAESVALEYLRLLAKLVGQPMGLAMVQAGIVGAKDSAVLGRLIKAGCKGAHKATLEEVEKIQEELRNERLN